MKELQDEHYYRRLVLGI